MVGQNYESYWKITLEYSDIHGERFRGTLKIIVDFINKHKRKNYSQELFEKLQKEIDKKYPKKDMASVRKSINQFVKLGFINFQFKSYHEDTTSFLEAKTQRKRKSIFSKIVYTNSSFNRSITNDSGQQEINFLIKTLEEMGKFDEEDIAGLMITETNKFPKGYLNEEELGEVKQKAKEINFIKRKYNQVGYLIGILRKLDDLIYLKKKLYFIEDAREIFGEDFSKAIRKRDSYLYRIYRNQLKEESFEKLGEERCMLEYLDYPSLVASHIKPFANSSDKESYDPDNGLLLSRNMDILFDKGYISFGKSGNILLSDRLSKDLRNFLNSYRLKNIFLNQKRGKYLDYHRKKVFR